MAEEYVDVVKIDGMHFKRFQLNCARGDVVTCRERCFGSLCRPLTPRFVVMAHGVVHPRVFPAVITVAGARRRVQRHVAPKNGPSSTSAASTSHPGGRRGGGKRGGGGGRRRSSGADAETKKGRPTTRRAADRSADTAVAEVPVPELTSAAPPTPSSGGGGGEGGVVVNPPRLEPISASGSVEEFLRPPMEQQQLPKDASSTWTRGEIEGALTVGDVRANKDNIVVFEDTTSTTRGTPVESTPSTSASAGEGDGGGAFAALLAKMFQHQNNLAATAAVAAPGERNGQQTRTSSASSSSPPAPLGFRSKKEATAVWTLGLLFLSYCHASSAGFILPALLPSIAGREGFHLFFV